MRNYLFRVVIALLLVFGILECPLCSDIASCSVRAETVKMIKVPSYPDLNKYGFKELELDYSDLEDAIGLYCGLSAGASTKKDVDANINKYTNAMKKKGFNLKYSGERTIDIDEYPINAKIYSVEYKNNLVAIMLTGVTHDNGKQVYAGLIYIAIYKDKVKADSNDKSQKASVSKSNSSVSNKTPTAPSANYTGVGKSGNNTYYFKEGKIVSGFVKTTAGYMYFDPHSYKMKTGWLKVNDDYYYFQDNGIMLNNGTFTIDGKKYSFDKNGKYVATPQVKKSSGYDFKSFNWGQTIGQVKQTEKYLTDLSGYSNGRDDYYLYLGSSTILGDYNYSTYYCFDADNKLYSAEYIIDDDARNIFSEFSIYTAYNQLLDLYKSKYGEPIINKIYYDVDYTSTSLTTSELVMIDLAHGYAKWETDTTTIEINYMGDDDTTPILSVTYTSKNYKPKKLNNKNNTANI